MNLSDDVLRQSLHREVERSGPSPNLWNRIRQARSEQVGWKRRRLAVQAGVVMAAGLVVLLAFPAPRGMATALIHSVTNVLDWRIPAVVSDVGWETLPTVVQEVLGSGLRSPDGRYVAAGWSWDQIPPDVRLAIENGKASIDPVKLKGGPQLWIATADLSKARLVAAFPGSPVGPWFEWSPRGTLLYYQPKDDSWQEYNPQNGRTGTFLASLLKGHTAGNLRFSQDGEQLLYDTGIVYFTNKPQYAPTTTYVAPSTGKGAPRLVGVNVQAAWEGDQVTSTVMEPDIIFATPFPAGPVWSPKAGDELDAMVRSAAGVEWRVYDSPSGERAPIKVLVAAEKQPGLWVTTWPGLSASADGPLYVELFAQVRPGVPAKPYFVVEENSRNSWNSWVTRGPFQVRQAP